VSNERHWTLENNFSQIPRPTVVAHARTTILTSMAAPLDVGDGVVDSTVVAIPQLIVHIAAWAGLPASDGTTILHVPLVVACLVSALAFRASFTEQYRLH
jgi:hypothetical protein